MIRIHRLPQQQDLSRAFAHAVPYFRQHLLDRVIALAATHIRNDAVGAGIVAASHDRDKRGHLIAGRGSGVIQIVRFGTAFEQAFDQ